MSTAWLAPTTSALTRQPTLRAPASSESASVLLVDDHPLYREALADLLRRAWEEPLRIVQAASAEAALQLAGLHRRIRLVVIDLNLPGAHGAEAIAPLCRNLPWATIVVVSGSEPHHDIQAAMHAGARAFISKTVMPNVMLATLHRALRGRINAPEVILRGMEEAVYPSTALCPHLTERQRQVLRLVGKGHTNKEIGRCLGLTEITVKQHVSRVLTALGVSNRTQAAVTARRMALETPPPVLCSQGAGFGAGNDSATFWGGE